MAAYCNHAGGKCEYGDKPVQCRKTSVLHCQMLKDKNSSGKKENHHVVLGRSVIKRD
jgi:hypothetical protein